MSSFSTSTPRLLRRWGVRLLLALLLGLGLLYWQRWDLLRWGLQEALAYRLGATVRLGAVQPQTDGWRLSELYVESPTVEPRLESLHLPQVTLIATWPQLRRLSIPRVTIDGGRIELAPTAALPEESDESARPDIGELRVEGLEIVQRTGDPAAPPRLSLRLQARIYDLARAAHGEIEVTAQRLQLAPLRPWIPREVASLAAIDGAVDGFAGHLTLAPEGVSWQLEASSTRLRLDDFETSIEMPNWQASYEPSPGRFHLSTPELLATSEVGDLRAELLQIAVDPTAALHSAGTPSDPNPSSDPDSASDPDPASDPEASSKAAVGGFDLQLSAEGMTLQPAGSPSGPAGTPSQPTPTAMAPWREEDVTLGATLLPIDPSRGGGWRVHAEPQLAWFHSAHLDGHWLADGSAGELTAEILGWRLRLPPHGTAAELDVRVTRRGEQVDGQATLQRLQGEAQLRDLRLHPEQLPLKAQLRGQLRDLDGSIPWLDGSLELRSADDLTVRATGAWHLFGSAAGQVPGTADGPATIDVEVAMDRARLSRVQGFLAPPILPHPWRGEAVFSVTGRLQGPVLAARGMLSVELHEANLEPPPELRPLLGDISLERGQGTLRVADPPSLPRLSLDGTFFPGQTPPVSFSASSKITWDAEGRPRQLDLQRLQLTMAGVGKAEVRGSVDLPTTDTATTDTAATYIAATNTAATSPTPRVDASIDFETLPFGDLDPEALQPLLPSAAFDVMTSANLTGRLRGSWQLTSPRVGSATATQGKTVAATPVASGAWHLRGPITVQDLGYSSADGSRVMEGLQLRFESQAQIPMSEPAIGATEAASTSEVTGRDTPWTARLDGEASGFLLLWDTFFGDFSQWRGDAVIQASGPGLSSISVELELPEGPQLRARLAPSTGSGDASATSPRWSYGLSLRVDDLSSSHRLYLAPTFGEMVGDSLSGRLSLQVDGELDDGAATSRGQLVLRDLAWAGLAGTSAQGLELHLPFDWNLQGDEVSGPRNKGSLRFAHLGAAGFELPATDTGLWTEGRAVGLDGGLVLPLYGGEVVLDRLQWRDLLGRRPRLQSALDIRGVDMGAVAEAIGLPPLAGTLEGRLERLEMAGQELRVDGGGRLSLFGGYIDVDQISGSEVLSRFPRLTLSATVHELDLGQLTQRLDFGEMHGTLQGTVDSCTLFRGVPVTCKARFETVDRPGVRRSVDVKAVNNLTVLGTGSSTNVLDRGIQRLFKRFTYAGFGVDIELADDSLLLRGLEKRGSKELFMRGRLPFPIDIINAQPGRRVSFQAMLQRLQSLDFNAATTVAPDPDSNPP